jgi:uncharacterized protein (TIGR01244 family)
MQRHFLRSGIACCFLLTLNACNSSEPRTTSAETLPATRLERIELGSMRNLHRFGDIYFADQPTPADFELFRERGVRTVIDIRHDEETPELDERQLVTDLDMQYVHVPWNGPDELNDAIFDELRAELNAAERPILFHCASANRVGAIWLAHRVLDDGIALEDAHSEAVTIGMRTPAYEVKALDYVRSRE